MRYFQRYVSPLLVVVCVMALAGCNLLTKEPLPSDSDPDPDPSGPPEFAFYYDFSDVEPGDLPSGDGWSITGLDGERGDITIVNDTGTDSGRAIHVATNKLEGAKKNLQVRFPKWEVEPEDAKVIAYEFKFKVVSGDAGMYVYVNPGDSNHRIVLLPAEGRITWHASLDGGKSATFRNLEPGWNTIRVVGDRTTRLGDVYINDMETPVGESLQFQRVVETWNGLQFVITHESNPDEMREAYYADFKVWVMD